MDSMELKLNKTPKEFCDALKEGSDKIIGYYPTIYKPLDENWATKILTEFEDGNVGLVYSDIIINIDGARHAQIYESYYPEMFRNLNIVLSPIFVRANEPIDIGYSEIHGIFQHHFLYNLSKLVFPLHIPTILFEINIDKTLQNFIDLDIQKIIQNENLSSH